jgi:hypothetical protein
MLRNSRGMLTGLGLGLGLMYFMDPERGRRRRALVRDRITHATRACSQTMGSMCRDLTHRSSGLVARARGVLRRGPVDDEVLAERVRARLGRLVSHPHAISVNANDGSVHLRGAILESELPRTVRGIAHVPGVRDVISALDIHQSIGSIPALQGSAFWQRG